MQIVCRARQQNPMQHSIDFPRNAKCSRAIKRYGSVMKEHYREQQTHWHQRCASPFQCTLVSATSRRKPA